MCRDFSHKRTQSRREDQNPLLSSKTKAGVFEGFVDLLDSINIRCNSERNTKSLGSVLGFLNSLAHNFFETRVDDINFSGTSKKFFMSLFDVDGELGLLLDDLKEIQFGLFFPLLDHSAWSHVIKVLKPFEVRDSDTTSIQQDIRKDQNSL